MSNIQMRDPKTDPPPKDGTMFIADICMQKTYCCMWSFAQRKYVYADQTSNLFQQLQVDEIFWWCEMPIVSSPTNHVTFPCELTGEDQFRYEQQKKVGEA